MEGLTRLVSESFARHGFDRPLDYRRLHWSRWFPCHSPHSLLFVPSKPGVFALAEEVVDLGIRKNVWDRVSDPVMPSAARLALPPNREGHALPSTNREGHDFRFEPALSEQCESKGAERTAQDCAALAAEGEPSVANGRGGLHARRMLAVLQFCEDDDMAFVLDRMFSRQNPMCARLASGRCFVRFVVLEDHSQRRSICNALNQWLISSTEVTTGIGAHFASSLELTDSSVARAPSPANAGTITVPKQSGEASTNQATPLAAAPQLDSGAAANIHCPSPFPSGF